MDMFPRLKAQRIEPTCRSIHGTKRDLMAAKLRECENIPGEIRDTYDCINVNAASIEALPRRKKRWLDDDLVQCATRCRNGAAEEVAEPKR